MNVQALGELEEAKATILRLRAQNKASSDAWTLKIAKLERRYYYYSSLFGSSLRLATRVENEGKCFACWAPTKHPHRIAQTSQNHGSLMTLDRMLDVIEAVKEWRTIPAGTVHEPEVTAAMCRIFDAIDALETDHKREKA